MARQLSLARVDWDRTSDVFTLHVIRDDGRHATLHVRASTIARLYGGFTPEDLSQAIAAHTKEILRAAETLISLNPHADRLILTTRDLKDLVRSSNND